MCSIVSKTVPDIAKVVHEIVPQTVQKSITLLNHI